MAALAKRQLDVFESEPLADPNDPLLSHPNLIATPHIGFVTEDEFDLQFSDIFGQVNAYVGGAPPPHDQSRGLDQRKIRLAAIGAPMITSTILVRCWIITKPGSAPETMIRTVISACPAGGENQECLGCLAEP